MALVWNWMEVREGSSVQVPVNVDRSVVTSLGGVIAGLLW